MIPIRLNEKIAKDDTHRRAQVAAVLGCLAEGVVPGGTVIIDGEYVRVGREGRAELTERGCNALAALSLTNGYFVEAGRAAARSIQEKILLDNIAAAA